MNELSLAPISISVYNRLQHLKLCLDSIKNNSLAKHTEIYIFSDAPKKGDENEVGKVREFCKSLTGFKKVHLHCQPFNNHKKNIFDARTIPLNVHGRSIFLEDDNVVSQNFLKFMNEALELYAHNPSILAISGYSPPVNQRENTKKDVYLSKIFSAWTYATWSHKKVLDFSRVSKPYNDLKKNGLRKKVDSVHPSLAKSLKKIDEDLHYAPDQVLTYALIKNDLYQIKPVETLVRNIGHDGTGINCGVSGHFNQIIFQGTHDPSLENLNYINEIDRKQYDFFYPSLLLKLQRRFISFKKNVFG